MPDLPDDTNSEDDELPPPDPTQPDSTSGSDDGLNAFMQGMRGDAPSNRMAQVFQRAAQGPGLRSVKPISTVPPPDQVPPGVRSSRTARDLSTFAKATNSSPSPAPSELSQAPPPPQAPTMPPDYAAAQADLRKNATVTPKYDAATGKPLDKYKMGVGQRLGRIFQDLATGGVRGVMSGIGNRNDPGYYGPGAVSNQYDRDEAMREARVAADKEKIGSLTAEQKEKQTEFADQNKQYEDQLRKAYEADEDTIRQKNADEKVAHDTEVENLKKQLQDATTPEAKAQAEFNARQNVANEIGLKGQDRKMYLANGKLPDDELKAKELEIAEERLGLERDRAANEKGKGGFTAVQRLRLNSYMKTNGIKSGPAGDEYGELTPQQVDEALATKYVDPNDQLLRGPALQNFKNDSEVRNIDGELKQLTSDKDAYTFALGSDKPEEVNSAKQGLKGIEQRIQDLTQKRDAIREKYRKMQSPQPTAPVAPPHGSQTPAPTPAATPPKNAAPVPNQNQLPKDNPKGYKNPKTGQFYKYAAKMKDGSSIVSDDGKSWFDRTTGKQIQ